MTTDKAREAACWGSYTNWDGKWRSIWGAHPLFELRYEKAIIPAAKALSAFPGSEVWVVGCRIYTLRNVALNWSSLKTRPVLTTYEWREPDDY